MNDLTKYSPELRDIISRPQERFTALLWWFLVTTFIFFIVASIIIPSPDILTAEAKVSSSNPPVVLKNAVPGRLMICDNPIPGPVHPGDYLAVIGGAGNWRDIRALKTAVINSTTVPDTLSLGDVSSLYYSYRDAVKLLERLKSKDNEYIQRCNYYTQRAESDEKELSNLFQSLKHNREQLAIRMRQFEADSLLFSQAAILETEYYSSLLTLLNTRQQLISTQNNINAKRRSIEDNRYQAETTKKDYLNQVNDTQNLLNASRGELLSQIENWEEHYVLLARSEGFSEWASSLSEGEYLQTGTPVFNIIHKGSRYSATAVLPATGAGKAAPGQRVRMKIDAYPYTEYGMLEGTVRTVNLNTLENNYLVQIDLINGIRSTTGKEFTFAETLYGRAEIITRKRKLISKIFFRIYDILSGESNRNFIITEPNTQTNQS